MSDIIAMGENFIGRPKLMAHGGLKLIIKRMTSRIGVCATTL